MNGLLRKIEMGLFLCFLSLTTVSIPQYLEAHSKLKRSYYGKEKEEKEIENQIRIPSNYNINYMLIGDWISYEELGKGFYGRRRYNFNHKNESEN